MNAGKEIADPKTWVEKPNRKDPKRKKAHPEDLVFPELFQFLEISGDNFFITGKAGTGKSTFIQSYLRNTQRPTLLLASTGLAAVNIGGLTVHSFFQLKHKPILPNQSTDIKHFSSHGAKYKLIQEADTIIIDEVSMIRADVLQAVDYSLRVNGGKKYLPFGGKRIILLGDIFQIPPVVGQDFDKIKEKLQRVYKTFYFFSAPAFKAGAFRVIELEEVFRQNSDPEFVELLEYIRLGNCDAELIEKINQKYQDTSMEDHHEGYLNLTTTNKIAACINKLYLDQLPGQTKQYHAKIHRDYAEERYPTDAVLNLKEGARVMMIKNDSSLRWVNGSIGKIIGLSDRHIDVELENKNSVEVLPYTWNQINYVWNKKKKEIEEEITGTFSQFPLKSAWAITIHKSQGLTFDKVNIHLGRGAFSHGQFYVAMSRCRSFAGIRLSSRVQRSDIFVDPQLLDFYENYIRANKEEMFGDIPLK
jgi:ATP-dependent DNA helicase PIF1